MTDEEAEALVVQLTVARLMRIWVPDPQRRHTLSSESDLDPSRALKTLLNDGLAVTDIIIFGVINIRGLALALMRLNREEPHGKHTGVLMCNYPSGTFRRVFSCEEDREAREQFAQEWMPFFRRGCWLSGLPIEASAHEKAEWIQRFSREETEAWNLKF